MVSSSPLAVGQSIQLHIDSIAYGGDGVGRVDDFVVFIPFTAPGERVQAEVVEAKKNYARARLIEVLQPSPDRTTPPCPYYGECGGCQYQHLTYPAQLALKHQQIRELIRRLGGFANAPIDPVIPCPSPFGYRNRIMVRSQWHKPEQRVAVGFLRAESRLLVEVDTCAIAEPALNQELAKVRIQPPPKGGIKVNLRLPPQDWDLPPDSFFQNNFHLLPALAETVRQRLQDGASRYLIDAYCGVGFFAIECAPVVDQFTGVEIDKHAIRAARRNLDRRNIRHGDFISGPAEEWIPSLLQRFPADRTAVITDPPRTGCAPDFIDALRRARPAQVIYVSCHPATLSRDLQRLCVGDRYRLARLTPLDMFPQTQHVECVADLRLNPAA